MQYAVGAVPLIWVIYTAPLAEAWNLGALVLRSQGKQSLTFVLGGFVLVFRSTPMCMCIVVVITSLP